MANELYVGHISDKATELDLRKLFAVVGTVTSVHLITDPQTGQFKGCGYVRMATAKEAKEAIETLDGAILIDRVITVSEARPQKPKGRPGGGGRGPGRGPSQGPGKTPGRTGRGRPERG
jgi:RNA recognition motif-containing protein